MEIKGMKELQNRLLIISPPANLPNWTLLAKAPPGGSLFLWLRQPPGLPGFQWVCFPLPSSPSSRKKTIQLHSVTTQSLAIKSSAWGFHLGASFFAPDTIQHSSVSVGRIFIPFSPPHQASLRVIRFPSATACFVASWMFTGFTSFQP